MCFHCVLCQEVRNKVNFYAWVNECVAEIWYGGYVVRQCYAYNLLEPALRTTN